MCRRNSRVMLKSIRRNLVSRSRFAKWLISNEICANHPAAKFKDSDYERWAGRTVIITGVTRGIGFIILKKLLYLKMNVIIGCRNTLVCRELLQNIQEVDHIDISRAIVLELDFMCLCSVRQFVEEVHKLKLPLHLLLNNARLVGGQFSETNDGFEVHFQANCLSPFLLINLLLPLLVETSKELGSPVGRIVNVSSGLMRYGKLEFEDLEQRSCYNPLQAYFNTQLIQTLLFRQLFTNIRKDGHSRISVSSVHPGITACELPFRRLSRRIITPLLMNKEHGANQVLCVALSSQLDSVSGEFFMHPTDSSNTTICFGNEELQEKLWNIAMNYVHAYTKADGTNMKSLPVYRMTSHNYDDEDHVMATDDTLLYQVVDYEF